MPAETRRRWTAREVRDLIATQQLATPRYELVGGELLVTPSPAPAHQFAVGELLVALREYLGRERVGRVMDSPADVELEDGEVTQPDVFVVPADEAARLIRDGFPARQLLLAAEVSSPSSARYDRVDKRALYQRNVPEYWVVDTDARLIERWRPSDTRPEILTQQLDWHPAGAREAFALDLPSYFARVFGA